MQPRRKNLVGGTGRFLRCQRNPLTTWSTTTGSSKHEYVQRKGNTLLKQFPHAGQLRRMSHPPSRLMSTLWNSLCQEPVMFSPRRTFNPNTTSGQTHSIGSWMLTLLGTVKIVTISKFGRINNNWFDLESFFSVESH